MHSSFNACDRSLDGYFKISQIYRGNESSNEWEMKQREERVFLVWYFWYKIDMLITVKIFYRQRINFCAVEAHIFCHSICLNSFIRHILSMHALSHTHTQIYRIWIGFDYVATYRKSMALLFRQPSLFSDAIAANTIAVDVFIVVIASLL